MYDIDYLIVEWFTVESDRAERATDNLIQALAEAPLVPEYQIATWVEAYRSLYRTGRDSRRQRRMTGDKRQLTPKQREALQLYANGLGRDAIGQKMNISPETVKNHLARARYKLGALTSANAVKIAVREGLIN